MTKVIARVHPVHLMNVDRAPGGHQPSEQTNRLGLWVRRKLAATIHIPCRYCYFCMYLQCGWLSSRVVSLLDWGAEGPGFISQSRCCRGNSLNQFVHTHCAPVHHTAKLMIAALLRVAVVTAGLVESNGSLRPGLLLTSPAGWLPRTGISSRTLRSVIEYGLPLPFLSPVCL